MKRTITAVTAAALLAGLGGCAAAKTDTAAAAPAPSASAADLERAGQQAQAEGRAARAAQLATAAVPGPATVLGTEATEQSEAIRICRQGVPDKVKTPSTVEFVDEQETAHEDGPHSWSVRGRFDAENNFGATIRNGFLCGVDFGGKAGTAKLRVWVYECPCKNPPAGRLGEDL